MKPGIRTTEFAVVVLMIGFGAFLVWLGQVEAGITMANTFAAGYVGLRSGMKRGEPTRGGSPAGSSTGD